jgi:hypothetical protein
VAHQTQVKSQTKTVNTKGKMQNYNIIIHDTTQFRSNSALYEPSIGNKIPLIAIIRDQLIIGICTS